MSTNTITCEGSSCVGNDARRTLLSRAPAVSSASARNALQLCAAVLTAATLAACAQSPGVPDRRASLGATRLVPASPEPSRKTTFVSSRANVTKRQAAETTEAASGLASFYGTGQGHGPKTANGEKFNGRELTAAHRTLPFGTRVRVTNVSTGRSVTVRVNDRGPFVPGRVIDVSQAAAEELGMVGRGVTKVKLDVVQ
jgi:rare lipoprotein A